MGPLVIPPFGGSRPNWWPAAFSFSKKQNMVSLKRLNRLTITVTGGVSAVSVRFPRALDLVARGRAEWVNHPVDDPGKVPCIRIVATDSTRKAQACEYDRIQRRMNRNELRRIPFVGNIDLLLGVRA